ncbi:MAG: hypothetical protein NVSMB14_04790 [Isosphaeraceae bacterium]
MRLNPIRSLTTVATVFAFGLVVAALADDGPNKHGAPLYGGKVAMTKEYHFEVVFAKDGFKVFPRDHEDKLLDASKLTGTATFYHPNSPKAWFERKLTAIPAAPGRPVSFLGATIDLSKVPATGAKVEFQIAGLLEEAEKIATFTVPFSIPTPIVLAPPAPKGQILVGTSSKADAPAIAAQKTCPVSHEPLGSMGAPLKVSRDGKALFLCCKGCLKQVQANPDKYLGARN